MIARKNAMIEALGDWAKEMGDDAWRTGRRIWLAGLGVVATAEERSREAFDGFVAKGEKFEKREDTALGSALDRTAETLRTFGSKVEEGVQTSVATVLNRAGIPSHKEIHTLIDRVEKLTKKVEAMRA
jgi:poly(hydroxyalkanoate) granule-associated protein